MNPIIDWLLSEPDWIALRTRLDLLDEPVQPALRSAVLADPMVQGLIASLSAWPWKVIASHRSAAQPFHQLTFLADLGLTRDDPGIAPILEAILTHRSAQGPFALPMNLPESGETWAWALCDAPLVVSALARMGFAEDQRVQEAAAHLVGMVRENGWPCGVSPELGRFRGPGRKEDPCPFATLAMLRLLAFLDPLRDSPAAHSGAQSLLSLWTESRERHPYMFFMGDDFRKLKIPFIWYDLMHVLEVLTRFPWLRTDARLLDMHSVLQARADAQGRFTVESLWTAWKDWEFGQKKRPSRWLTLCALRIARRVESPAPPSRG